MRGRSQPPARAGPRAPFAFPAIRGRRWPTACASGPSSIAQVPLVASSLLRAARRRGRSRRPARAGGDHRRHARRRQRRSLARSRCTRRSAGSARSSTPTSARTRRVLGITDARALRGARPRAARRHAVSARASRARLRARPAAAAESADAAARHAAGARRPRVLQLLYGSHPYGHLPIGSEASLRGADVRDVRAFHRARFVPSAAT